MDKIIIYFEPFSTESKAWIVRDGQSTCHHLKSSPKEMVEEIVNLSYSENIYNVSINAPYAITNEIIKDVKNIEQITYSTNKINIEGI